MTARRTPTRFVIVSAAGLLALTGLAACSSSSSDSSSSATAASSAVASATTVNAAFEKVATATASAKSVKGTLTTTTAAGDVDGEFAYKYTADGLLASFTFEQAGKPVKGVITPEAIYIGGEGLDLPGGKAYLRIDTDEDNQIAESYRALTEGFTKAANIEETVAEWKQIGNLKAAGTESVDGVTATKYVGTVDPANPPAGASQTIKDAYAALVKAGVTSIETTIWVGPNGLPLKVSTKSVGEETTTSTIVYSDWGTAVDVKVPAASEVADLSKALDNLG